MFEHLEGPSIMGNSFTKYPEGVTVFEALLKWVNLVNSMIDHLNLNDEQVATLFTQTLPENVTAVLTTWYNNGQLASLINGELLAEKADTTALTALQNAINADIDAIQAIIKNDEVNMNTSVGYGVGELITTGNRNTSVGTYAGNSITSGMGNSLLGSYAGQLITVGLMNCLMGHGAGRSITTAFENVAIGYQVSHANVEGNENVALGHQALYNNVNGDGNTVIGHEAGFNHLGNYLTAIGYDAGKAHTSGIQNTLVGVQTGLSLTDQGTNTFVGYQSGVSAVSAGNTGVGANTLVQLTSGDRNTAIGKNAGLGITTGAGNVFIGAGAGETGQPNNVYNSVAIGLDAIADVANAVVLGNVNTAVVKSPGSFETTGAGKGFILKSPNGTRYRITVSDAGALSAVLA